MITLEKISKTFGSKKILQNFSLTVKDGELFTLIGESGCGKTTLLRIIAGFEQPDDGKVFIGGKDIIPLPIECRSVGVVFQNYALFPHLSVYDNIAVGPRIHKTDETDIALKIKELLKTIHLEKMANAHPNELSGGEKQRVAIARAIINRPKILLLDEPFSALDPSLRENLRSELSEIQRLSGSTFLMVTHDQEEALELSHRVGVMKDGCLQQSGSPVELYKHPVNHYVASFLGKVNRLEGAIENQNGSSLKLKVDYVGILIFKSRKEYSRGTNITLYIRPENISISFKKVKEPCDNEIHGHLIKSSFRGHYTLFHVALKNGEVFQVLTPHNFGNETENFPIPKTTVTLFLHPDHLFLVDGEKEYENPKEEYNE